MALCCCVGDVASSYCSRGAMWGDIEHSCLEVLELELAHNNGSGACVSSYCLCEESEVLELIITHA